MKARGFSRRPAAQQWDLLYP